MGDLDKKLAQLRSAGAEGGGRIDWSAVPSTSVTSRKPRADLWSDAGFPELANAVREICMFCGWTQVAEGEGRTLAVASARDREGKSSLAWALAIATAQDTAADVALVECDLIHSVLGADIGAQNRSGLSEILEAETDLVTDLAAAMNPTGLPNLSLLAAGRGTQNPSRLLRSARMLGILSELQRRFAFVILDLPSLLKSSEAAALSRIANGVVLVVRAGVTDEREVQRSLHLLSGANIHGVVLNRWRPATPRSLRRLVEI
jgi:succinoglycan biosynthesis transport protein ExoP